MREAKGVTLLLVGFILTFLFWSFRDSYVYGEDTGFKYIKNWKPEDYKLEPQNWAIIQDKRGMIYVGNVGGLLEFDGVRWRLIDLPNWTVRSMALDETGLLYIGGRDEIGFLEVDSTGNPHYVSLLDQLDDNKKSFYKVWRTHSTKEGIYFRTTKFLFRWNPKQKQMKVWESAHSFKASFSIKGRFFIHDREVGLMHIVNDSLKLVPGGEAFTGFWIYMMVPYETGSGAQRYLIGTRKKGFYIYDGKRAIPFPTDVDDYVKKSELSHGIRLSSSSTSPTEPGDIALATLHGGLVIIDPRGRLKQKYTQSSGLLDGNVKYVFEDSQGNLWLACEYGLSRIEYKSPFSICDNRYGLSGLVLAIVKHRNRLYVGTTGGLYFLASSSTFQPLAGMTQNFWSLLSTGGSLLAAASNGVFQVENNTRSKKVLKLRSYCLEQSGKNPNRIWVGTQEGLVSLFLSPGNRDGQYEKWEKERQFENITGKISTIVEDPKGNLWLGTETKGVIKVDFPRGAIHSSLLTDAETETVTRYQASHGLPPKHIETSPEIRVFKAAGHIMFATGKGIFRFDEDKNVFIPDFILANTFADGSRSVFNIKEDKNKHIWIHSFFENFQAIPKVDGTFVINAKPFLRLSRGQVNAIYPDPDGKNVWFGMQKQLIRYDKTVNKNYRHDFQTFIRKVVANGKDEIFTSSFLIIPYKKRNLRFEFAAPFFENESATEYQFFLEGYDKDWSDWAAKPWEDYFNLNPGIHCFRVRARNVYQHVSSEDVFRFKILPPWYQTWWAFLLYVIGFLLVIYFTVRWRSRKLELEKQRLEQIIKERTREIEEKNQQLEEQSEQLKEMDKVKSRFFANISHEFRTPLTLIMGPLEQMLSFSRDREQKKQFKLMIRNSQRLLTLINQLLALSKLDSGKLKLQARPQHIVPFLKGVLASFESVTAQNKILLKFSAEKKDITLYFDHGKLEDVISNLLINAVKFTPAGGTIAVAAKVTEGSAAGPNFPSGSVDISVRDTGVGIPGDQLEHIFERFYQARGSYEKDSNGTGIGLALAKDLVSLHYGEIHVTSRVGENSGTEFIIRLPLGKEHLKPEDIAADIPPVETEPPRPFRIPGQYKFEIEEEAEVEPEEEVELEEKEEITGEEKHLILVVEDNAEMCGYIRDALEPHYTVVEAADGREGIDKARTTIPDLIVSDIMMPEIDGYKLCKTLKTDVKTSHVPVILLTAKASEESVIRGLETGADDYVTKPFNTEILKARIKNLIDLRRQLQQKFQRQMLLQPTEIPVSSVDQEFIKELQYVIEKNLSNPEFSVEELCNKLYMSRATLYRKVMALTGESPTLFIRSYRLKRAVQLLKNNFGNVTEVAFEVGFSSTPYFTKCFKEKFYQLPSSFQAAEAK